MSTLSQFLGGDSTPIGQMAYLGITDEPATVNIGSQKWLRTGVLAPAASYPSVPVDYQRVDVTPRLHETLPQNETYNSIATNGTIWVAVGENSALATSSDGLTWTRRTIPSGQYKKVIWTGTKFAAVGWVTTNLGTAFATSSDGISWSSTVLATGPHETGNSIAWNGTIYVIVGGTRDQSGPQIRTSPDGITWTKRSVSGGNNSAGYNDVVWSGSQWVAVGRGSTTSQAITSPDGITWTPRNISGTAYDTTSIAWNGSIFVVGISENTPFVFTSTDGITWISRITNSSISINEIIWSGSKFFAVGASQGADNPIITSTDGITWTPVSYFRIALKCIAFSGVVFHAIGVGHLARSSDSGTTWVTRKPQGNFSTIAYNGSVYVMGGTDTQCGTSTDGVWWVKRSNFTQPVYKIMTSGSLFVAIGGESLEGSAGYITTSTDGVNWTTRTSPGSSVIWVTGDFGAGRFVISAGTTGAAQYTSTDGITWVNSPNLGTSGTISNVTFANGIFFALATSASGYSYDGITWRHAPTLPTTLNPLALAWNGSVFATVSYGKCFTSTDGVNWTSRTSTFPTEVNSIAAVGGTFIAYTTNKFHTSNDGINWSPARSGVFSIAGTSTINGRLYFVGNNSVGSTSDTKYVGVDTHNKYQYMRVE